MFERSPLKRYRKRTTIKVWQVSSSGGKAQLEQGTDFGHQPSVDGWTAIAGRSLTFNFDLWQSSGNNHCKHRKAQSWSNMVSFDTVWPADSLEFCPAPGFQDIFVCGTYKLLDEPAQASSNDDANGKSKTPQTRRGQCLAFKVAPESENGFSLCVWPCSDFWMDSHLWAANRYNLLICPLSWTWNGI